ncbi:MAG: hypothetical protein ACBR50_18785 [Microcoleus sp.]
MVALPLQNYDLSDNETALGEGSIAHNAKTPLPQPRENHNRLELGFVFI